MEPLGKPPVPGPLLGVPRALLGVLDSYELSAHEADSFPVAILAIIVVEHLQHSQDLALTDFGLLLYMYIPSSNSHLRKDIIILLR